MGRYPELRPPYEHTGGVTSIKIIRLESEPMNHGKGSNHGPGAQKRPDDLPELKGRSLVCSQVSKDRRLWKRRLLDTSHGEYWYILGRLLRDPNLEVHWRQEGETFDHTRK